MAAANSWGRTKTRIGVYVTKKETAIGIADDKSYSLITSMFSLLVLAFVPVRMVLCGQELPDNVKEAAKVLGYSKKSWDKNARVAAEENDWEGT